MTTDFTPTTVDPNPSATPSVVATLIRSVLISVGGILVTKGYIDATTLQSVVGALLIIGPAIWGVVQKLQAHEKLKAAIAAPAVKVS